MTHVESEAKKLYEIYTVYVHAIQRIGAVRLLYCSAGGKILKYFIKHLFFIIIFLSLCSVSVKTHVKEKKDEDDRRAGEHEHAGISYGKVGLFRCQTYKLLMVVGGDVVHGWPREIKIREVYCRFKQ